MCGFDRQEVNVAFDLDDDGIICLKRNNKIPKSTSTNDINHDDLISMILLTPNQRMFTIMADEINCMFNNK